MTEAGTELLREGGRLLNEIDAVANRVKRVATGWEPQFTVAVDSIIARSVVMELSEGFLALNPPTRLRIRYETLSGTLAALKSGQADLAIGVFISPSSHAELLHETLGQVSFVYAVAPHHPLANAPEPLSDAVLQQYRAVAVADSVPRGEGVTIGLTKMVDARKGFMHAHRRIAVAQRDSNLQEINFGCAPGPLTRPSALRVVNG